MAKMTPQELMDLPGYGSAEKQMRKDGRWRLSPTEIIEKALDDAFHDIEQAAHYIESAEYAITKAAKEAQCN